VVAIYPYIPKKKGRSYFFLVLSGDDESFHRRRKQLFVRTTDSKSESVAHVKWPVGGKLEQ